MLPLGYLLYQRAINSTATQKLVYNGSSDSSKTSFLVGGLIADTLYIFSVAPVNQYGLTGLDGENAINSTTSAPEVPFPPENVTQSQVDGGYMELSFSEPFYTGGFSVESLQYSASLKSLSSCFADASSCSTCTHALDSDGFIQALAATSNSCSTTACAVIESCCLNDGTKCGILMTETKNCAVVTTARTGICRVEGLHFTTRYITALAATNSIGKSPYSNSIVVTTSNARRPDVPRLDLGSASGGSIELKWTFPAVSVMTVCIYLIVHRHTNVCVLVLVLSGHWRCIDCSNVTKRKRR